MVVRGHKCPHCIIISKAVLLRLFQNRINISIDFFIFFFLIIASFDAC